MGPGWYRQGPGPAAARPCPPRPSGARSYNCYTPPPLLFPQLEFPFPHSAKNTSVAKPLTLSPTVA